MASSYTPLPMSAGLSLSMPLTRREEFEKTRGASAPLVTPAPVRPVSKPTVSKTPPPPRHVVPTRPEKAIEERQIRIHPPSPSPKPFVENQETPEKEVVKSKGKGKKRKTLRGRVRSSHMPGNMPVELIIPGKSLEPSPRLLASAIPYTPDEEPSGSGLQASTQPVWAHEHLTNTAVKNLKHQLEGLICSNTCTFPKEFVALKCGHVFDIKFQSKHFEAVTCFQADCKQRFGPLEVTIVSQPVKIQEITESFLDPIFPEDLSEGEYSEAIFKFAGTLGRYLTPAVTKRREECRQAIHNGIQAAVRTLPTYGMSDILIPDSDQDSSDDGECYDIPPLRKRPLPAGLKTGTEPGPKIRRQRPPQKDKQPFVVRPRLRKHWKPFDGNSGHYNLTHVIVPTETIDRLEGTLRHREIFPTSTTGETLAQRMKQAAEEGIRFQLQKQSNGSQVFIFNPDLPPIMPNEKSAPKNHWKTLRSQLDRYGIRLDDTA